MKQFFIIILSISCLGELVAHPSYGLVITEKGNLVFCDVLHDGGTIWQFDKQGKLSQLLTEEHCHFIFLDHRGNIWGTNHEYLPSTDNNRNTLWKLVNEQKEIIIKPTTDPELFSGVNFVVDKQGNIFFNHNHKLYKRDTGGQTELFIAHEFERVNSLQMDMHDNIYVMDMNAQQGTIFNIDPSGQLIRLADSLIEEHPENPPFPEPRFNMFFGAYVDQEGNVYVANSGPRRIIKVYPNGEREHIYHSQSPWYPVAYTQKEGTAYVMEMGYEGGRGNFGPRIIRISNGSTEVLVDVEKYEEKPDKKRGETSSNEHGNIWLALAAIVAFLIIGYFRRKRS